MHPGLPGNFITLSYKFKSKMLVAFEANQIDLSIMHFEVLKSIECNSNCTSKTICKLLSRDKAQITRLVNLLLSKQFITKKKQSDDGRASILILSAKGKEILNRMEKEETKIIKQLLTSISNSEVKKFNQIISIMHTNLES